MNFASPNGESDDGGELYEPHDIRSSASANNAEPPRLLTSKEKVFELQQLLEEQSLQNNEIKIQY